MASSIIIIGAIALYAGFVIRRQIINWKKGKYCGCDCEGCGGSCHKTFEDEK